MPSKGKGRKKKKSGGRSLDFSAAENFLSNMDFGIDLDFNSFHLFENRNLRMGSQFTSI